MPTTIKEFAEKAKKKLKNKLGDGIEIKISAVTKNNDVSCLGLSVRTDDNWSKIIYINDFYETYIKNSNLEDSLQLLVDTALKGLNSTSDDEIDPRDMNLDILNTYSKDKVFVRLVNLEMNKKRLEDVVYRNWLDLAMEVRVLAIQTEQGIASASVTKDLIEKWDVSESDVFLDALKNTEQLFSTQFKPMADLFAETSGIDLSKELKGLPCPLYVLTNNHRVNGAIEMALSDEVEKLADKLGEDIYILPSSIHEVILTPASLAPSIKEMFDMVRSANDSIVDEKERLSYSVYRYDRNINEIIIEKEVA